ncbi:MAG: sigma-54-dependent Fis family transcriptional regulator [Planctomycetes bacterium]|nr:sigma-54-dependent Fis family transcriptional regulator [Planctomycetota bacterium]
MTERRPSILIVDDEFSIRDSLTHWFRADGFDAVAAEDAQAALRAIGVRSFDVALVDIRMPGMDGVELQQRLQTAAPEMAVIMMTAFASVDTAVLTLKRGAFDYVTKPVDPDELGHLVQRALEQRRLREENVRLKGTIDELVDADPIVGDSEPMHRVLELVRSVAATDTTVLIRGESGTGKELIARAIHALSPRRYFPLVPVNCGGLPGTLLESELFGHERGAFTGARERRNGRIEMADGGTLFLDEVGTIDAKMQVDLLRVLETKEFTRVGGNRPIKSDFRVICATNEDLERAVAEGRLREDFYYRINVVTIVAPPLRERPSDIPLLVEHFVRKFARQMDKRITGVSDEAMEVLLRWRWPGNVRELSNAIERAMVVGKPPLIQPDDLPVNHVAAPAHAPGSGSAPGAAPAGSANDSLADVERRHIAAVLERTGWNITRAAQILEVDRVTVYNKIKKYGLQRS